MLPLSILRSFNCVCQVLDDEVSAEEVEGLVSEADAYSLASHLLWAIWSLLQSKVGGAWLIFASTSSSVHSFVCLFVHALINPCIYPDLHSVSHASIQYPLLRRSIHPPINPPIHLCTHPPASLIRPSNRQALDAVRKQCLTHVTAPAAARANHYLRARLHAYTFNLTVRTAFRRFL